MKFPRGRCSTTRSNGYFPTLFYSYGSFSSIDPTNRCSLESRVFLTRALTLSDGSPAAQSITTFAFEFVVETTPEGQGHLATTLLSTSPRKHTEGNMECEKLMYLLSYDAVQLGTIEVVSTQEYRSSEKYHDKGTHGGIQKILVKIEDLG
jgi:hypothetical protein